MPANSSVAAKKRSLNDTRRRTKERLLREQAQLGAADAAPLHEASSGLAKRMKLYAHMKNVRPAAAAAAEAAPTAIGSSAAAAVNPVVQAASPASQRPPPVSGATVGSVGGALSVAGGGVVSNTVHRCVIYTEAAQRLTGLVEEVEAVRRAIGGGRRRAKVVVMVKSKKAAEKLAPRLGWNGASAEMWTTEKTGRWGFGSIKRVRE